MIDLDAVSRTRLWEHNQAIARWTRLSGSTEERHAAEYAADQLRGFGLATRILTHDAFISLPLSASLRLVRPQQMEISCITHMSSRIGSASTLATRSLEVERKLSLRYRGYSTFYAEFTPR